PGGGVLSAEPGDRRGRGAQYAGSRVRRGNAGIGAGRRRAGASRPRPLRLARPDDDGEGGGMTAIGGMERPTHGEGLDVERVRRDFPILAQRVHDKPLVYFDSAASAQKPSAVIDRISRTYETEYAN